MLGEPVQISAEAITEHEATTSSPHEWTFEPGAPPLRRLSVMGIAHGSHDLARSTKDILRRELGGPDA